MFTPLWFVSIMALLVVNVRTGSLQQKDKKPQQCYYCSPTNNTCDHLSSLQIYNCPENRPYCATTAVAPNFTSSLQCASPAEIPCKLTYSTQGHELQCICTGHLCNAPFSLTLLNTLRNFTSSSVHENKSADLTDSFFKRYNVTNVTDKKIYKMLTMDLSEETEITERTSQNISQLTTVSAVTTMNIDLKNEIDIPQAAARKQEAAAPSDDDEDESEGSGSYDESKSQRHPPSAPAAPSSFLPAKDSNKSPPLYCNLYLTSSFFVFFIIRF
ncbi:uncharacterized protein LOC131846641 [Achroia grisella]|uniref:uncharacterized protein LOC131846641 n=1 Tax=Achroia grisella TaxID=688607 RepID=UPI0027D21373|nr:uncharacterized protein LOC131846641 [Achroia grisella]